MIQRIKNMKVWNDSMQNLDQVTSFITRRFHHANMVFVAVNFCITLNYASNLHFLLIIMDAGDMPEMETSTQFAYSS